MIRRADRYRVTDVWSDHTLQPGSALLRDFQEDGNHQQHRCDNLRPRMCVFFVWYRVANRNVAAH